MRLDNLPSPLEIDWLLQPDNITVLESRLRKHVGTRIFTEILSSHRVPLLHLRARRLLADSNVFIRDKASLCDPQGYLLSITRQDSRKALLRLLLAEHGLRCEMGRRDGGSRACRLCAHDSESEMHVMFFCTGNPSLVETRVWLESVRAQDFPSLSSHVGLQSEEAAVVVWDSWLQDRAATRGFWPIVARACFRVLAVFDEL